MSLFSEELNVVFKKTIWSRISCFFGRHLWVKAFIFPIYSRSNEKETISWRSRPSGKEQFYTYKGATGSVCAFCKKRKLKTYKHYEFAFPEEEIILENWELGIIETASLIEAIKIKSGH